MEDKNIMTLTDENGNNVDYELLDIIQYNNKIYTVFYPTDESNTEVIILRVEEAEDREKSYYVVENDENIVQKVYEIFKEKYEYDDEIEFKD